LKVWGYNKKRSFSLECPRLIFYKEKNFLFVINLPKAYLNVIKSIAHVLYLAESEKGKSDGGDVSGGGDNGRARLRKVKKLKV
jgi:hypothetical protein